MSLALKKLAAVATIVVIPLGLAACGNDKASPSSASSDYDCSKPDSSTKTDINIVGMPILSNGALYLGADKGFFAKNGLNAKITMVPSLPAATSAVVGGTADFGFTSTMSLLQAAEQGQHLVGVAPFAGVEPGYYDKMKAGEKGYQTGVNALLVKANSGIDSPKDLEGKSVAVADPALSELLTKAEIARDGGDLSKVRFVVMTGPDAYNAVLAGKVDAAQSFVPIIDGYEAKGLKNLSWLEVDVLHDGPTSLLVSSSDYVAKHPDTVARFECAIVEAAEYSNAHKDEVRAVTAREQKIDPGTLASAVVPYFYTKVDTAGVKRIEDLMTEFGFLKSKVAISDVIADVSKTSGK